MIQNSRGEKWAVSGLYDADPDSYRRSSDTCVDRVRDEISLLWEELRKGLTGLDHVVVYVGSKGSERAIALAAELPESKVTFVGCDCAIPQKMAAIEQAGLSRAGRILSECGGRHTMKHLYDAFMAGGLGTVAVG